MLRIALIVCTTILLSSCANFYTKTLIFNQKFESGDYETARKYLDSNKKIQRSNNKVLYDLNYATVSHFLGEYETSVEYFKAADDYFEYYTNEVGYEALALISNAKVKPYEPESFERVMLHFYQALNFIFLNDYESAMVECRRMNLELNNLSDKYKNHTGNRYSHDAFGHYIMGILYETTGDHNNAFIAYRNALEIYESDYLSMFNTPIPSYLKTAVIRSAYNTGFTAEAMQYEEKYSINYSESKPNANYGRIIAFVFDGLSPIKIETSINFTKIGNSAAMSFASDNGALIIPIPIINCTPDQKNALTNTTSIRMTLPEYSSRSTNCSSVVRKCLTINGSTYSAVLVEDIESIAPQSLNDRFWLELGSSILRLATKQFLNQAAKNQNEYLGLLVTLTNTITEQADTRHWQSLPGGIRLIEVYLPEGEYIAQYSDCSGVQQINVKIESGKTSFVTLRGY